MSARPGILTTVQNPSDGGVSPNRYVPWVTAEIRCHWPPRASRMEIVAALDEAYQKAIARMDETLVEIEKPR